jgi:hypothetical protein
LPIAKRYTAGFRHGGAPLGLNLGQQGLGDGVVREKMGLTSGDDGGNKVAQAVDGFAGVRMLCPNGLTNVSSD